jgi:PadR family transcriptional regulator, regulatory protein PadR
VFSGAVIGEAMASTCSAILVRLISGVNIGIRNQYRSSTAVSELLTKMFLGGFVRMHILYHAAKEPVFGVEMMEELGRHGYDVGAGTLYPMLHQLEEAGYLNSYAEVVAGKLRKYYRATSEGAAALEEAKTKLRELVSEILQDKPPKPSIRSDQDTGQRRKPKPGS